MSDSAVESTAPEYSILITGYRSLRFLKECLGSLLNTQGPSFEILFLDNGSPQPEAQWIRENIRDPRLRVFEVPDTLYFASGNNYVADRARGEFLVFLNSDTLVDPDWLVLVDRYLKETGFELAQADLRGAHGDPFHAPPGYNLDRMGLLVEKPEADYVYPGETFLVCAAALAVRREVFFKLGKFDDSYRMYWEDIDLCWRANLFGYRIGYVPGANVYHVGAGSSRKSFFQWNHFRVTRNRTLSFAKNAGPGLFATYLGINILLRLFSIPGNALKGQPGRAVTEAASVAATLWMLGPALLKRRAIQSGRTVSDAELAKRGYILSGFKYLGLRQFREKMKTLFPGAKPRAK
jgi:N-acetylglucosaminyl-diphospho-decaprenol L-rhamnosyltransferase